MNQINLCDIRVRNKVDTYLRRLSIGVLIVHLAHPIVDRQT